MRKRRQRKEMKVGAVAQHNALKLDYFVYTQMLIQLL